MKKIFVFVFILILILIVNCNNSPTQPKEELIGNWQLVKTITYWPIYSETDWTDSTEAKILVFDDTKVKIRFKDFQQICTWTLNNDSLTICDNLYLLKIKSDTLLLSQSHVDGPSEYYIKNN